MTSAPCQCTVCVVQGGCKTLNVKCMLVQGLDESGGKTWRLRGDGIFEVVAMIVVVYENGMNVGGGM